MVILSKVYDIFDFTDFFSSVVGYVQFNHYLFLLISVIPRFLFNLSKMKYSVNLIYFLVSPDSSFVGGTLSSPIYLLLKIVKQVLLRRKTKFHLFAYQHENIKILY